MDAPSTPVDYPPTLPEAGHLLRQTGRVRTDAATRREIVQSANSLDAGIAQAVASLFASEVEKGGPPMMLMNPTRIAARDGGAIRIVASGTDSFGAVLRGRFPAAI